MTIPNYIIWGLKGSLLKSLKEPITQMVLRQIKLSLREMLAWSFLHIIMQPLIRPVLPLQKLTILLIDLIHLMSVKM